MNDTELLDWLEEKCLQVRCTSLPNADAGDFSEHWEVYEQYWGGSEKVVGCGSSLRAAIFDATLDKNDPRRSDYVPPDAGKPPA